MKKIFTIVFFVSVMCGFAFAQSNFPEFEKAKQIKLLESTKEDVLRIFKDYRTMAMRDDFVNTENANISIGYSSGNCADKSEEWNISEGKVTFIRIYLKKVFTPKSSEIDLSDFKKERLYVQLPRSYIYYNKDSGIAVGVINNEIENIFLFPPKAEYSKLCDNQSAREFYTSKKWFVNSKLKYRIHEYNGFADVVALDLSRTELYLACDLGTLSHSCPMEISQKINVSVKGVDPENDVFTYEYAVSGGKIVGQGSKVIWNLSDVKPGTYTIEAGVNDGCGICGATITKTVVIKECPDCSIKDN